MRSDLNSTPQPPLSGARARPLVGRRHELANLAQHLDAARRGEGTVALIADEPGIGKTRLLLELADRARDLGGFLGRSSAHEERRSS